MKQEKPSIFRRFNNAIYRIIDKMTFLSNPLLKSLFQIGVTIVFMAGLICLVYFANIPNPNMILITGLVIFSSIFGWEGAAVSSIMMIVYSMFFFSTDHSFFDYTKQNLYKLIVIIIGCVLSSFFICVFRRNIKDEREDLLKRNEKLSDSIVIDALTGVKNRYGFRSDIENFVGKDIIFMIMDIDNFKEINDTYGHLGGDRILTNFAGDVVDIFGHENTYRYGGDEFIVISPDEDLESFEKQLDNLKKLLGTNMRQNIKFSAGFVSGKLTEKVAYQKMLKEADKNLYASKNSGKDCYKGSKFQG